MKTTQTNCNYPNLKPLGYAWAASGLLGFFGEGYWWHLLFRLLGLCFHGITFVAKTVTIHPRLGEKKGNGNAKLKDDCITLAEWFPKCIFINPKLWLKGVMINAVGLSNMGARLAFEQNKWQKRKKPFMISFMPVGKDREERLEEIRMFREAFGDALDDESMQFAAPVALQLNISCPNTGHAINDMAMEAVEYLDILEGLCVPIVVKVSATFPIEKALVIIEHKACSGISPSNTIAFGDLHKEIEWEKYFGTNNPQFSPLTSLGFPAGGLSGKAIFWPMIDWVRAARKAGITKHINAGGGIFSPWRVLLAFLAGADSVSLGTVANHRPWMMLPCIWTAKILGSVFYCLRK